MGMGLQDRQGLGVVFLPHITDQKWMLNALYFTAISQDLSIACCVLNQFISLEACLLLRRWVNWLVDLRDLHVRIVSDCTRPDQQPCLPAPDKPIPAALAVVEVRTPDNARQLGTRETRTREEQSTVVIQEARVRNETDSAGRERAEHRARTLAKEESA